MEFLTVALVMLTYFLYRKTSCRYFVCIAAVWLILIQPARADYLSFSLGHSAQLKANTRWFADAGFILRNDYSNLGFRYGRLISDRWLVTGQFGLGNLSGAAGSTIGLKASYGLKNRFEKYDLALSLSYAVGRHERDNIKLNSSSGSLKLLISERKPEDTVKLRTWYVEIGVVSSSIERLANTDVVSEQSLDPSVGIGIIYPFMIIDETPTGFLYGGEVYGGLDFTGTLGVTLGFRYRTR